MNAEVFRNKNMIMQVTLKWLSNSIVTVSVSVWVYICAHSLMYLL